MRAAEALAVVPFRLASARFPEKALCRFQGLTLLEHAVRCASALTRRPVVVTAPSADLERARGALDSSLALQWVESSIACSCATDRVVEILPQLDAETVLSVPVDEPLLQPEAIARALDTAPAADGECATTFYCDFYAKEDYLSPLSAKVVLDSNGTLLYMSRAIVPVRKDGSVEAASLKKNVGVFVFPHAFLVRLAAFASAPTVLDALEGLEQLRWLELGMRVRCLKVHHIGFGVDVPEQLTLLAERLRCASLPTKSA